LSAQRGPLLAWLVFVAACAAVAAHTRFTADMSAFLPEAATPAQRLLVGELREGVAARLLLVGIEGAAPGELAALSRALAKRLQAAPEAFVYVANGDAALAQADRDFLFAHRYALSPGVAPGRFDRASLAAALERGYEALASPAGALVRRYLPADPTGEFLRVLGTLEGAERPPTHLGVWMSRDQRTALLLAQTAAPGFDLDAQEANLARIGAAFAAAREEAGVPAAILHRSGPAVFAVLSRETIRGDVRRLSTVATAIVAGMLLLAFRSPAVLGLAFVPVATGALAGVAAVSLVFGTVHGITLGFGVVLIGEAIDYAIYFYAQRHGAEAPAASFARIWPTLRLGLAVSAASFCAMLFAGFPGLAQIGLFAVAGLVVAAAVTRWVLPAIPVRATPLRGAGFFGRLAPRWRSPLKLRLAALGLLTAACAGVIWHQRPIWDDDLARLNPAGDAEQALDRRLREALGAPDARWLVAVSGATADAALEAAEALAAPLARLVADKAIAGFDSPVAYLPSARTQAARRAALPDDATLRADLAAAVAASPFKPDLFEPFLRDVAAARAAPPLERARLAGTAFGLKTDLLLVRRDDRWHALLPLRGVADAGALAARIAAEGPFGAALLDIRAESTALLASYRERALALWGIGLALIVALLALHLRSALRVAQVLAPIAAAVAATATILLAAGTKLTLFHLVALLLVAGVGSNYALFFEREPPDEDDRRRTAFAVAFCAATTALAFGLLAWSQVPVLKMIGATAAIGAVASLAFATLIARGRG
jgi:predicted exporter